MAVEANSPDFVEAMKAAREERLEFDETLALELINKMLGLVHGPFGDRFRWFRDKALFELGITDLFERDTYKSVVGKYFGHRAHKKNVAQELPVEQITDSSVCIQVLDDLFITFETKNACGKVEWLDLKERVRPTGTRAYIPPKQWQRAKKKALVILNERRERENDIF